MWYYLYDIQIWNHVDLKLEWRQGVVAAHTMQNALEQIIDYYGEPNDINTLRALSEKVCDFHEINNDCDSDCKCSFTFEKYSN